MLQRARTLAVGTAVSVVAGLVLTFNLGARSAPARPAQPAVSATAAEDFTVQEATIEQLQAALGAGDVTSQELVQIYLQRIAQYDDSGPKINSVLELNPDALDIAARLDAERAAGLVRGPLHGIPILIKGNIATDDRMDTTAGSVALVNSTPQEDAFIVKRLRAAGAVILGKSNLTEFANFMSYHMPSGYSSLGGQTLNPYNPALGEFGVPVLTPCGSSAGSGAGTAANLTSISIGTETSGSILCPSSFNAVVGIKTTLGLVSRSGIIPIASSQDVAGPMTRTVADAATLLNVMAGVDPSDPPTLKSVGKVPADYRESLKVNGLSGARIGIARQYFGSNEETIAIIEKAIADMAAQGAVVVDPVDIPTTDQLNASDSDVLIYEFKQDLNAYLATVEPTSPVKTLKQVIEYNRRHPIIALEYGQGILLNSQNQSGTTITKAEAAADRARDAYLSRTGIDAAIEDNNLDCLIVPSNFAASIGAKAGYPTIVVPAGYRESDLAPVGVSFLGKAFTEPRLIELAYSYEQATLNRRPPASTP